MRIFLDNLLLSYDHCTVDLDPSGIPDLYDTEVGNMAMILYLQSGLIKLTPCLISREKLLLSFSTLDI